MAHFVTKSIDLCIGVLYVLHCFALETNMGLVVLGNSVYLPHTLCMVKGEHHMISA